MQALGLLRKIIKIVLGAIPSNAVKTLNSFRKSDLDGIENPAVAGRE